MLTGRDKEDLIYLIENEGIEYTFMDYSDFEDITDEKFHELRKAYIAATKALEDYIAWSKE